MDFLLPRRIERRDRRRGAAGLADAQQTADDVPHDDVAVTVPRAAHGDAGQIAQRLRQTA